MSGSKQAQTSPSDIVKGVVVAAFGRHYEVMLADGTKRTGYPRGKKSTYACGDCVTLSVDGQLFGHDERKSLLYRSDAFREKLMAANATQLVLVVATEPSFDDALISRSLMAAEQQGLRCAIVLNKIDKRDHLAAARATLEPFLQLGYPVIELCARLDVSALIPLLTNQVTVLVGQSGMGKSTLTNALVPSAAAATREISAALDSGKHTTTCTRLYALEQCAGQLIDSPGLQEFGLAHLTREDIEDGFRELRPLRGKCRYRDCRHHHEPDCAFKEAVASGTIHPRRIEHFRALMSQIESRQRY